MTDTAITDFARAHRHDDVEDLLLHASRYPDIDVKAAAVQIQGWQLARQKLPTWAATEGILYPPHLAMEQCSSEPTARYKLELAQRICQGHLSRLADLTGGFGVDGAMMARAFSHFLYVERQEQLCGLARHNLPLMGIRHSTVCQSSCEDVIPRIDDYDLVYLDPARRDGHGGKVAAIADCTPDILTLLPSLRKKARKIMVKLSPMLDVKETLRQMQTVEEIHVVALHNECKELVVVMGGDVSSSPPSTVVHAVNLPCCQDFSFTLEEERDAQPVYASHLGAYLYEPHAALMKAGAFRLLSIRYGLEKLHPSSHLYTADELRADFPGRIFKVERCEVFSSKMAKTFSCLGHANVAVRNFPMRAEQLCQRLRLRDGGDSYLFGTTLRDAKKVVIECRKITK